MLVINRFRVTDATGLAFQARMEDAIAFLRTRTGLESLDWVQNLDEPDLWCLLTRWRDVGSYRRALQGYEAKVTLVPLLSEALDEPSAYADPDEVGFNIPRGQ